MIVDRMVLKRIAKNHTSKPIYYIIITWLFDNCFKISKTINTESLFAEKWPKTASGLPSTAGTTASIAFIRRGKIFIGHVGDSAIILGVQDENNPDIWRADPLTIDHKPESLGKPL